MVAGDRLVDALCAGLAADGAAQSRTKADCMKAITLTQPWATLVAIGAKRLETRSWRTSYRGPLAIHAAAGYGKGGRRAHKELCGTEPFCSVLNAAMGRWLKGRGDLRDMVEHPFMPMGAIIAVCHLTAIYRITEQGVEGFCPQPPRNEIAFGDYTPGRYAWLLSDIRALPEPIPAKGALGLWGWDGVAS
jgi:hypothetical protein